MRVPGTGSGLAARHLRQQGELGGERVFLDRLTEAEAVRLAEGGRKAGVERAPPVEPASAAPRSPTPDPTGLEDLDYQTLREEALRCRRCPLAETRTHVVFSAGNPEGRLMVVGEAPGAREDATGRAFVGRAGKLLDLLLATIGLDRERTVYICNVLKCRPPGNRNPLPEEIETCTPYLRRQIDLVAPEAILAAGTFAAQFLTGRNTSIGRLRGEVYSYEGVPLVVTYHPAALLRNPGWIRPTWDDLQLLRQIMDGP